MAKRFSEVDLAAIDEGRFLAAVEADLAAVQTKLIRFREEYGEAADKAKAELTIKLTIQAEKGQAEFFSITASTTMKIPARPASLSMAMAGEDQTGSPRLFAPTSGADDYPNPRQAKLTTSDGRTIDPETGEAEA